MADTNGSGLIWTPRRLRVTYATQTYTVETPDGETVSLRGYVKGPGCPISVEIDVEGAWAEWSEDSPTDDDRAALTTHRYLAKMMRAERMLRRNLLCAAIPGLAQDVADVLAGDDGPWEGVLVELGWWQPTEAQATEGEAPAGDSSRSTGPDGLPAGSPATDTTPSTPAPAASA